MISLSSIVKAKLLTVLPPKSLDYGTVEDDSPEIEKINPNEANEMKENIIRQALKKAKHIENEAKMRADSLVENAMKSSREIMSNADQKGYEEGYLRGLIDGANASEKAAEEGLTELNRLIQYFKTEQREALGRSEEDLLNIAFELSRKIMKQYVQLEEASVIKMLEEMIQENEGSMKIYLSEYQKTLDFHIDKTIAKKIKNLSKDMKVVMIKEEDLIMSENEGGIVDMSVPVQLEQLKKAVDHIR